jgi:hypothetical protein
VFVRIKALSLFFLLRHTCMFLWLSSTSCGVSPRPYELSRTWGGPCAAGLGVQGESHPGVLLCDKVNGAAAGVGSAMERPQSRLIPPPGCAVSRSFSLSLLANDEPSRKDVEVGNQDIEMSLKPFLSSLLVLAGVDSDAG